MTRGLFAVPSQYSPDKVLSLLDSLERVISAQGICDTTLLTSDQQKKKKMGKALLWKDTGAQRVSEQEIRLGEIERVSPWEGSGVGHISTVSQQPSCLELLPLINRHEPPGSGGILLCFRGTVLTFPW